jgi:hypothetical protein
MQNSSLLHVYFNFNPLHISSTFMLIIRRVRIVLIQRRVYISLCEWPSGMQGEKEPTYRMATHTG